MVEQNPNMISKLKTGHLSATADSDDQHLLDGTDAIHSGLIKALNCMAQGNYVNKGMNITQSSVSSYTRFAVAAGGYFQNGKYYTFAGANADFSGTVAGTNSAWYALLVIADGTEGGESQGDLKIRGTYALGGSTTSKGASPKTGDTPIAFIQVLTTDANDATNRKIQFLTARNDEKGLSVGYDNSGYTETLAVSGASGGTTITNKVGDLILDNTDTNDQIIMQLGTDTTATSFQVKDNTGNVLLDIFGDGTFVMNSATASLQVEDSSAGAAITLLPGTGPKIQFGDTDSAADQYMSLGAFGGINQIESTSRDFAIESSNGNWIYCDHSSSNVGIGDFDGSTAGKVADNKLHVKSEDSADNTILYPLKIERTTTDTSPAVGIGVGMQFEVETDNGHYEIGGAIESVTTDVSTGSEDLDMVFKTMGAGTLSEGLRVSGIGDATIAGDLTITGGNIKNAITCDSNLSVSGNETITGFTDTAGQIFTQRVFSSTLSPPAGICPDFTTSQSNPYTPTSEIIYLSPEASVKGAVAGGSSGIANYAILHLVDPASVGRMVVTLVNLDTTVHMLIGCPTLPMNGGFVHGHAEAGLALYGGSGSVGTLTGYTGMGTTADLIHLEPGECVTLQAITEEAALPYLGPANAGRVEAKTWLIIGN